MKQQFYDLSFEQLQDGTIRLEQMDYAGESVIIDLHPAQLRHIAESFGLVAPSYPDDELSKRLARQLCTIQRELADERHRSHWLEMTFAKLDGYCTSLPETVFPYDLWEDGTPDAQEAPMSPACEPNGAPALAPDNTAPKRARAGSSSSGAQLGLDV